MPIWLFMIFELLDLETDVFYWDNIAQSDKYNNEGEIPAYINLTCNGLKLDSFKSTKGPIQSAGELLKKSLDYNPKKRPTLEQIYNSFK